MPTVKRSTPSEDIMPNVLKVLELILTGVKSKKSKSAKLQDKYSQIAAETCQPQFAKTIAKQCVGLTNSALCGHRYTEAAKLLWVLCQDRSVFDMFIFRAAMIVLENLETGNQGTAIHTFCRDIQDLELVNKKEVQLEYLIHGLTRRCLDLKGGLQALINMKRKKYLRKNALLDPIFEGYLMYLDWIELCDFLSKGGEVGDKEKSSVDEALLKFTPLLDHPGDWDIFVLKLVELLEKCQREEEIKYLLLKYVEGHPDSLNAHIYLSLHLCEVEPDSELLVQHLQIISEMSPSDERVLILLEKLEILGDKLEKCFMFLDYPINGKNERAWSMLLKYLDEAKLRGDVKTLDTIKACWTSRQKSWYWLYFNPSQVPQLQETELIYSKMKVLYYLEEDHEFIKKVQEKFPTSHFSRWKETYPDEDDRSENMLL